MSSFLSAHQHIMAIFDGNYNDVEDIIKERRYNQRRFAVGQL